MRPFQGFSSIPLLLCLLILVVCKIVHRSRGQFIDDSETDPDDEEDESIEDETPEEKAARKNIQEDSNLPVVCSIHNMYIS